MWKSGFTVVLIEAAVSAVSAREVGYIGGKLCINRLSRRGSLIKVEKEPQRTTT